MNDDKKRTRTIALPPQAVVALKQQLQNFRDKFGREPGPRDPVFFDPDADTPIALTPERFDALFYEACSKARIPKEHAKEILAYLNRP